MAVLLTDKEIAQFLVEPKLLPPNYRHLLITKPKRGHKERELVVKGNQEHEFHLILRQNLINTLDFSVILAYAPSETMQLFRLRRYNGKSHEHTNTIEGNTFYDFHIHTATERYQQSGLREDTFAEACNRYQDFNSAIRCMFQDCGFILPPEDQTSFGWEEN
jgi:hypothetical protein